MELLVPYHSDTAEPFSLCLLSLLFGLLPVTYSVQVRATERHIQQTTLDQTKPDDMHQQLTCHTYIFSQIFKHAAVTKTFLVKCLERETWLYRLTVRCLSDPEATSYICFSLCHFSAPLTSVLHHCVTGVLSSVWNHTFNMWRRVAEGLYDILWSWAMTCKSQYLTNCQEPLPRIIPCLCCCQYHSSFFISM